MAKILDKLLPNSTERILKLRQSLDWVQVEIDALEEKYQTLKNKEIKKFTDKANKALVPSAYKACDKSEYADNVLGEKLQAYDVKNYLKHRAANHKAAKEIFKAIKEGSDYSSALEVLARSNAAMLEKRDAFVAKLELEKEKFLKSNNSSDNTTYESLSKDYILKYEAFRNALDEKYGAMYEAEKAKLEAKAEILQKKIDAEKAKGASEKTLDDDVILSVKGLKMYFGGLRAVDDLSFDVKKGEIFGLIGPNGAGKTTVFNCITQFYKPTAGELIFTTKDGETITLTDYKVHDIVLKGIARTFQNVEVVKEVSVLDNLLIAATRNYSSSLLVQMLHLPKLKREEKIIRARADKILKYMDLYAYRDRLAWGLPYGVLKRIEIARALMCNPQLVILDEPAAGLNESETHALAEMINKIRVDFDCTVLLVEHDMGLVMSVCDHICAISFGKKLACGTPAEVQSSKEVQEAYLGVGEE